MEGLGDGVTPKRGLILGRNEGGCSAVGVGEARVDIVVDFGSIEI